MTVIKDKNVKKNPYKKRKTLDNQGFFSMICSGLEPLTPTLSRWCSPS